jgi:hypothetical protein
MNEELLMIFTLVYVKFMWHTTSKFRTVAIFVTVDLQTIFYTKCEGMFIICICIEFDMLGYNGLLVVTTKLTAKHFFRISAMPFYIVLTQKLYRPYFSKTVTMNQRRIRN